MFEIQDHELKSLAPAIFTEQPHPDCSERYMFIPTIEVVSVLRNNGWKPIEARQSDVRMIGRASYAKHMIRFQYGNDGIDISDQERVDLVLYNSHDRGATFQLSASIWRKICANGLLTSSDLYNFAIRHIGKTETFLGAANQIVDNVTALSAQVNRFKTIDLSPDEKGVFCQAAHQLVYDTPEDAPIRPEHLLLESRYDDKGNDLWTKYNVIQENIIKGGLKGEKPSKNGKLRKITTRPVKSIQRDIKLNKALWMITEKMAELKSNN